MISDSAGISNRYFLLVLVFSPLRKWHKNSAQLQKTAYIQTVNRAGDAADFSSGTRSKIGSST